MSTAIAPTPVPAPVPEPTKKCCMVCWDRTVTPTSIKNAPIHPKPEGEDGDIERIVPCIDRACHACWRNHASSALKEWRFPSCIAGGHEGCTLLPAFMRWLGVDPALIARIDQIHLRRYLLLTPGLVHCTRPGCPNSFLLEHYWCSSVVCPACKWEMCTRCKEPAHRGVCGNNTELKAWCVARDCRPCPNCKRTIEKNDGCNHMTCSQCEFQFCWDCLVKYSPDHTCPPPSPRPPLPPREPRVRRDLDRRAPDRAGRPPRPAGRRRPGIQVLATPTPPVPAAAAAAAAAPAPDVVSKKAKKEKKKQEKAAAAASAGVLFDLRSLRRSVLV